MPCHCLRNGLLIRTCPYEAYTLCVSFVVGYRRGSILVFIHAGKQISHVNVGFPVVNAALWFQEVAGRRASMHKQLQCRAHAPISDQATLQTIVRLVRMRNQQPGRMDAGKLATICNVVCPVDPEHGMLCSPSRLGLSSYGWGLYPCIRGLRISG